MLDAMAEPKQKEMCVKLCELLLATAVSGKLKKLALRVCSQSRKPRTTLLWYHTMTTP